MNACSSAECLAVLAVLIALRVEVADHPLKAVLVLSAKSAQPIAHAVARRTVRVVDAGSALALTIQGALLIPFAAALRADRVSFVVNLNVDAESGQAAAGQELPAIKLCSGSTFDSSDQFVVILRGCLRSGVA